VEVVASPSQSRAAAAQCGLFTHKSVPRIFEPTCIKKYVIYQHEKIKFAAGQLQLNNILFVSYYINTKQSHEIQQNRVLNIKCEHAEVYIVQQRSYSATFGTKFHSNKVNLLLS
jgi:hypothetical protein